MAEREQPQQTETTGRMTIKIIDADSGQRGLSLSEVWRHRELAYLFARRQISSRYRQMLLGGAWAVLEPLATLALMTAVFGMLLRVDTNGYPYPVFAFAGLIPWFLFSKATMAVASSLQENMALVSKVYFPRLILPIAALVRECFDSLITVSILILLAAIFGFMPTLKYLLIVPVLLSVGMAAMGIGLWVAALLVRFRDIRPLLTIILQAGMYITPILYSPNVVPASLMPFYQINPMYWAVESFRWIMLGQPLQLTASFYGATALALASLVSGLFVFAAFEKETVDVQ